MKRLFLTLILITFLFSCSSKFPIASKCDNPPEPSKICEYANEHNINTKLLSISISISNDIAIQEGLYTKEQAEKAIQSLLTVFDNPITYIAFKLELQTIMKKYPTLIEFTEIGFDMLSSNDIILEYDVYLIKYQLQFMLDKLGETNE